MSFIQVVFYCFSCCDINKVLGVTRKNTKGVGGDLIMKNKYLLACMTLSIFLALSGCEKNESPQEDTTYNQNLHNDDYVDEVSDDDKNKSETSNEILDNLPETIGDDNQDSSSEQSNVQDNSNKQSNISDSSNENAYFLSMNSDFYEKVACNPIDQKYVIDRETAPLEILQSALTKCEAWNQQIDFTGSELEGLLSDADYEQLQNALSLWHEYYQEEVYQNRELYGNNGIILGSMYTAISADVLIEKCKLTSVALLSQEYELSNNVSFAENTTTNNESEYVLSPQSFCIEYSSDFEETLSSYSINEMNSDELEELIQETANKIEEEFGHDFTEHANKYVSFIHALYTIESNVSEDSNRCLILKENRLKLYAIELLNIVYMIDSQ